MLFRSELAASNLASSTSSRTKRDPKFYTRIESGGGSALDWFYASLKTKYTFQIKLRDTGAYGFLLPGEMIVPVGEEMVDAVKYFGGWILGNKGIESNSAEKVVKGAREGGFKQVKGTKFEKEKTWEVVEGEMDENDTESGEKEQVVMRERLGESWELRRRR